MRDTFGPQQQPRDRPSPPAAHEWAADTSSSPGSPGRPQGNWGLRYTSTGWEQPYFGTLAQRERARRSPLVSWLILGLPVGGAILSPPAGPGARARVNRVPVAVSRP